MSQALFYDIHREETHTQHLSSTSTLGCTNLGSAQRSLVVPFWLAHNLEIKGKEREASVRRPVHCVAPHGTI